MGAQKLDVAAADVRITPETPNLTENSRVTLKLKFSATNCKLGVAERAGLRSEPCGTSN